MDSTTYDVVLFIHLLGVGSLIVLAGVDAVASIATLRARTVEQLRSATWAAPVTGPAHLPVVAVFAGAGLWLASDSDEFSISSPWVVMAIVVTAVLTVVGATVTGRRFDQTHAAAVAAPDGPLPAELAARAADPVMHTLLRVAVTYIVGFLYLMTNKPGTTGCVALGVACLAVGLVASLPVLRVRTAVAVTPATP